MKKHHEAEISIVRDGSSIDMFVIFDGVKIAKRGHPGTPQAGTWVPLEPGWVVTSNADHSQIQIERFGARVH